MVNPYGYLGVWITNNLSWTKQIEDNCKKTNQKIGIPYCRFYQYCSTSVLKYLYVATALVRPHLEYAVPVWDPYLIKHIELLETFAQNYGINHNMTPYSYKPSCPDLSRGEHNSNFHGSII